MSGIKAANVKLKRAYEPPEAADGIRILVDRLWPRVLGELVLFRLQPMQSQLSFMCRPGWRCALARAS
jgi:hypothetical protein